MAIDFRKLKEQALKSPDVRAEYDALAPEYALVRSIIRERHKRGFSQQVLAERAGTRQPVISRLERGDGNPTVQQLQKIAKALDLKLSISLRK